MTQETRCPRVLCTVVIAGIAALLAACASIPAPKTAGASLLVGEVTLDATGTGWDPNGSDGTLNANYLSSTVVTLSSEQDGKQIQVQATSETPDGMFTFANLKPGQYRFLKLSQRLRTSNAFVDIESAFGPEMTIDVTESSVVDLGLIHWSFSYNLLNASSDSSATFQSSPAVMALFNRSYSSSPWVHYPTTSVVLSPRLAPDSSVSAQVRLIITQ